ncbi:metallophosphoesterase family protein [Gaoshiqia sp. Z1-71]|uniref:metallophosphoesterase family protein n=1 Tax=Gaoshiqia hydrogeniformans TaxID=3290090 RepID=UPI003BF8F802
MKKIFYLTGLMLLAAFATLAQMPVLKFNADKKFRIMQFTDLHFRGDSYRSDSVLVMVKNMVNAEKPDLVVFTGDVVTSANTANAWETFSNAVVGLKVPWAVVLGNHDIEGELNGKQIMELIAKKPYSLSVNGPENIAGNGNYVLKIQSSGSSKTSALLYFLDTHSGFKPKTDKGDYEWIDHSQVSWYREQSAGFTKKNGGNPYPALAFFHIPLPEYKEVVGKPTTVGSQIEEVCSPDINSGMYLAFLESKDVMGMFVGHDHNNNYIGSLRGICLAYGQSSGRQTYGSIGKGGRVIELYEDERKFDTWTLKWYECDRDKDIWEPAADRSRQNFVTFPESFPEN